MDREDYHRYEEKARVFLDEVLTDWEDSKALGRLMGVIVEVWHDAYRRGDIDNLYNRGGRRG